MGSTSYTFTGATPDSYDVAAKTATFSGLVSTSTYTIGITGVAGGANSTAGSFTSPVAVTGLILINLDAKTSTQFQVAVNYLSGANTATSWKVYNNGVLLTSIAAAAALTYSPNISKYFPVITGPAGETVNLTVTRIVTSGAESRPSNLVSLVLAPAPVTSVVLAPESISNTGFSLTWQGGNGATSYTFTGAPASVGLSASYDVAAKTATITVLNMLTAYTLTVTPINSGGSGTPGTVPIITGITGMGGVISGTTITVTWAGASLATSYIYTITPNVDNQPSTDNGVSAKTAIFTGLTVGTQYVITATPVIVDRVLAFWAGNMTIAAAPSTPYFSGTWVGRTGTGGNPLTVDITCDSYTPGTQNINITPGISAASDIQTFSSLTNATITTNRGGATIAVYAYTTIGTTNGWKSPTTNIPLPGLVGSMDWSVTKTAGLPGRKNVTITVSDPSNVNMTYTWTFDRPAGVTQVGASKSYTFTNMTTGSQIIFTVQASNAIGNGIGTGSMFTV